MFRKIEIWILYIILVFVFLFFIIFGAMIRREARGGSYIPIITEVSKIAYFVAKIPSNIKIMTSPEVRKPHKAKEKRFNNLSGFNGVQDEAEKYLLLPRFDGDLNESVIELIDLRDFKILHTWNVDVDTLWNKIKNDNGTKWDNIFRDKNDRRFIFGHPLILDDGSVLTSGGSPLIKINKKNQVDWIKEDEVYHHSIEQDIEGNIWIGVRYFPYKIDENIVGKEIDNYRDDGIRKISPNGDILFDKSISNIFIENDMEYLLFSVGDRYFDNDPIHLNDIQPVEKDSKYWKKGDVFLSLRHQSMIILYRPSTNKIIWKGVGQFYHQHDVDIIDEKRISIFDNNSKDYYDGDVVDGFNRIVIYDFEKESYSYYLNESLEKQDVRTITGGTHQIFPNGDLLVEETNYGRLLYFGSDGSLKWSYINRAEDNNVYGLFWARILYRNDDINKVSHYINNQN